MPDDVGFMKTPSKVAEPFGAARGCLVGGDNDKVPFEARFWPAKFDDKERDGVEFREIGFRAVATISEALSVAARILSFATWVTGVALLPRRQVPPAYQVPGACSHGIQVRCNDHGRTLRFRHVPRLISDHHRSRGHPLAGLMPHSGLIFLRSWVPTRAFDHQQCSTVTSDFLRKCYSGLDRREPSHVA